MINVGPVPTKLAARFDFGVKDGGSLSADVVKFGATQKLIEKSGQGLDAKIKGSLAKTSLDLLSSGQLPPPFSELPLTVKLNAGFLDGGISFKKLDVKLLTVSVALEGDFTAWLPDEVRSHLEAKGSVLIEFQLGADVAKNLIELGKAVDDVERSAELETEIAKLEKQLAKAKGKAGSTEKDLEYWRQVNRGHDKLDDLGPGTLRNSIAAAPGEIRELEKELNKLRGLQGRVSELRDVAIRKMEKLGAKVAVQLEKRVAGRFLKKALGKALSFAFKKFLPIYNTLSTIEDIYEAGKFLAGLNWGDIGKKIVDGGDGGTDLGDGTHREEAGAGGAGPAAAGGDGAIDPDAIQADLDRREHISLHPAAQAVVESVETSVAAARPGSHGLSPEDKETIDMVVPRDLTPDEIKSITSQLNAPGTTPQDTVEAVIAAVQRVRPFGEKRVGPEAPVGPENKPEAAATRASSHGRKTRTAGTSVLQLEQELERRITLDPRTGTATYPSALQIGGVSIRVGEVRVGRAINDVFLVKVNVVVEDVPSGGHVTFGDGDPVVRGREKVVTFQTRVDLLLNAKEH